MQENTRSLLSRIQKDISVERVFKHVSFLVNDVGERIAGTKKMKQAAQYIKDELERYGLKARIDHFPIYHSYPRGAALRVISPETRVITAKPACHIASTLPEGIEGELVYANVGGYEDYEGLDVRDKIVLTRMTWAPPRPEKARIAYEKGAKALVIMNWGPEDNPVIQMGGTKSQWGNPTPESFKMIPQLPVISVTRASGEYLRKLCQEGEVRVWLRAEATREWVTANQPVGVLDVKSDTEDFILVGGHLEAWGKTAVCNSSGNGVMLELARVLAQHRDKLKRNIVFAFWDGHEVAEAAVSQHCIAYVNIDNPGIKGTSVPGLTSVIEMKDFLEKVVVEVWNREATWDNAYKGGDNSFFGVGVPYISFYTRYTKEELKRLGYASLSPTLHSEDDTVDKLDKELLGKHLQFFTTLVYELANNPIIPYNLVSVADELTHSLEALKEIGGEKLSESVFGCAFDSLLDKAAQFKALAEQVNTVSSQVKESQEVFKINRVLIHSVRSLAPLMRSEAGRYGHDPYGYSLVGKPIPRLYVPIKKMVELDIDSDEFKLWETQFIRERNRVSDALTDVIEYAQVLLDQR